MRHFPHDARRCVFRPGQRSWRPPLRQHCRPRHHGAAGLLTDRDAHLRPVLEEPPGHSHGGPRDWVNEADVGVVDRGLKKGLLEEGGNEEARERVSFFFNRSRVVSLPFRILLRFPNSSTYLDADRASWIVFRALDVFFALLGGVTKTE